MTIQQMLAGAGGLRVISGVYWTTKASPGAPYTQVTSSGTTSIADTASLPVGTKKIIVFTGYGANHQYVEMTIAQWGAGGYGAQAVFSSSPFSMLIKRNGSNLLWNQSDGTSGNNTALTADTSKLFTGADGSNTWLVIEFWG